MATVKTLKRSTLGIPEAPMKNSAAWVRSALAAVTAACLSVACADSLTDVDTQLRVTVTPDTTTLTSLGERIQFEARVDVTSGSAPSPVWITRDVDVAAVGDEGRVLAVGNGETWIVAQVEAGGRKAADSARVTVRQVPVDLSITKQVDTLTWLGATTRLSAVALDGRGNALEGVPYEWSTSDSTRALVDSTGTVTAVANGNATISAAVGGLTAHVTMAVAQQVASVTVAPTSASVAVGGTRQFGATAVDAGGTTVMNVKFLWVSADANIAVVDTTGLATGKGVGSVTITAVGRGQPGNAVLTVGSSPTQPTKLAFSVQPGNGTAGEALSPAIEVEVRDANDIRVPDARVAVTLAFANNAGGGTLAGTKTVTAVNGIASFSGLWIDKAAGGYTLSATSGGLTTATSAGFAIAPGPPTQLTFGAQPGNVLGNQVFGAPVSATISDQFGNTVTSATNAVTMDFAVNVWESVFSSGSALLGTTTVNAVNGVATFNNLRVDKPGPGYRLGATAAGLTGAASNPFDVSLTVQSVGAGKFGYHTCAATTTGGYCWGAGWDGQLGDGVGNSNDSVPRLVAGGLTFTQVVSGYSHSCGLTSGGAAYCWGYNYYGQLGNNATIPGAPDEVAPVAVAGGLTFTKLSAGYYHTCGIAGTTAYCWGNDGNGQLGDDAPLVNKAVPTPVAGGLAWASISAGGAHTCGVTTGGDAYCWGYDGYGTLGNDSTFADSPTPVVVYGGKTWDMISTGYYQTCAVDAANAGFCWGYNYEGTLGADTSVVPLYNTEPTPRSVFGGLQFSQIGTGWYHSCGLTTAGDAFCWGAGWDGQLGAGDFNSSPIRVAVTGGHTFSTLSVGGYHTCAQNGNDVWCWGAGYDGQLGHGARNREAEPVQIVQ